MINKCTTKIIIKSSIIVILTMILLFAFDCEQEQIVSASDKIVFLGDSITSSFDLQNHFPDLPIVNSGVWGNKTDDAHMRIVNDVYIHRPRKVFILLGINDVGCGRDNEDITNRINTIILDIKENCPYSEIYLISVYPLNVSDFDKWFPPMNEDINAIVDELNKMLITLANNLNVNYIDMAPYLKNDNNELIKEYSVEGLHITDTGYEIISEVMEKYLE